MKTNRLQSDTLAANTNTPSATLEDNLRTLRLGSLLENARQSAEQAARAQTAHLKFLEQLIAGELAFRHDKSVKRRIHDARFPVIKTMAGWDWNWPAKLNRMHGKALRSAGACPHPQSARAGCRRLHRAHQRAGRFHSPA
jgi:DNA replication protein DnaC